MNQDTKAILARREAFVKSVLSKNEISEVKGGLIDNAISIIPEPCLSPIMCLTIIKDPFVIDEPAICLSPA